MHSKGIRKMALLKKLAGTKWGANMKIFTQICTPTVRPHMEYDSNAWSSAAKTNLDQLTKTPNAGLNNHRRYEDHFHCRVGKASGPAVIRGKKRGKSPVPKGKDEEDFLHTHYIPSLKFPPKQIQETEFKPPGQSASAKTQDHLISMQPTTRNASQL